MVATAEPSTSAPHPHPHDATPITPTTPVDKPVRGNKLIPTVPVSNGSSVAAAAASSSSSSSPGVRPDFLPPIPQKTPAVKFDLTGSATSAFHAVEPRTKRSGGGGPQLMLPSLQDHNNSPGGSSRVVQPSIPQEESSLVVTAAAAVHKQQANVSTVPVPTIHLRKKEKKPTDSRQAQPYGGPVDREEVSLTSTNFSAAATMGSNSEGVTTTTNDPVSMQPRLQQPHRTRNQGLAAASANQSQSQSYIQSPTKKETTASEVMNSPESPATPVTRNTTVGNWLEHQKEPFQMARQGVKMVSPPLSTRSLLRSSQTLPELEPIHQTTKSNNNNRSTMAVMEAEVSSRVTPPMSPLQLDESIIHMARSSKEDDSSTSPAPTSDVGQRLTGPSMSPPMSPFQGNGEGQHNTVVAMEHHHYHHHKAVSPPRSTSVSPPLSNVSPPMSTLQVNCDPTMLISALTLPLPLTPTRTDNASVNADKKKKKKKKNGVAESQDNQQGAKKGHTANQRVEAMQMEMLPPSPPLLNRTVVGDDYARDWLRNEKEPYQLAEMMQEEPMSPPISGTNLITDESVDGDHHEPSMGLMAVSPAASAQPKLHMTQTVLDELHRSQTDKERARANKYGRKQHHTHHRDDANANNANTNKGLSRKTSSSNQKKQMLLDELHRAQQVVRIVLKGSKYEHENKHDFASAQACFEAIRQYAELRVESSTLTGQLEDSKNQLKDLYLQWKGLRKEMQQENIKDAKASTVSGTGITQDSLIALQQLLSDDDSIYKEEDDTTTMDNETSYTLEKMGSFSLSFNVDQETDPVKAMDTLYNEMQYELEDIRSTFHEQKEQQRKLQGMEKRDKQEMTSSLDSEKLQRVIGGADVTNPFEGSDDFLLVKIEELTAQIENMEQDRVVLTGFMEQLTQEVVRSDTTAARMETFRAARRDGTPDNWTNFGQNFPICQDKESEVEMPSSTEAEGFATIPVDSAELKERPETQGGTVEGVTEDEIVTPIIANRAQQQHGQQSLMFRSRRFHASSDSNSELLMLPVDLPKSRGVSFERGELQQTLSEYGSEDFESKLDETLQKLSIFRADNPDEGVDSFGSSGKKINPMISFDSFFNRRRVSEVSSTPRRKLHGAFLRRKLKSKHAISDSDDKGSRLGIEKHLLSDDDSDELPLLALDPYSRTFSHDAGERRLWESGKERPTQKLESTSSLCMAASLPPTKPASLTDDKAENDIISRPPLEQDMIETHKEESYASSSSTMLHKEEDLRRAISQVIQARQKQRELTMELLASKGEAHKWERLAHSANASSSKSSCGVSFDGPSSGSKPSFDGIVAISSSENSRITTTNDPSEACLQEETEAPREDDNEDQGKTWRNSIANGAHEKVASGAMEVKGQRKAEYDTMETNATEHSCAQTKEDHTANFVAGSPESESGESRDKLFEKTGMDSTDVKLLEKIEECDRLSSQVTSLAGQLELYIAKVTQLENTAVHETEKAAMEKLVKEQAEMVGALKNERDVCQSTIVQMAAALANCKEEMEELKASIQSQDMDYSTSGHGEDLSNSASDRHSGQSRSVGHAKERLGGSIRGLFSRRRGALASSVKEKKKKPYTPLEENGSTTTDLDKEELKSASIVPAGDEASCPPNDTTIDVVGEDSTGMKTAPSGGSSSPDGSTATATSFIPFQSKTSMDYSLREDAQLATILSLTQRIQELEEENINLRSCSSHHETRE